MTIHAVTQTSASKTHSSYFNRALSRWKKWATLSLFLAGSMNALAMQTYYVSPGGDDTNDGLSEATPFETVQRAADLAQPGDVVEIKGGVYREEVIIPRSGTSSMPITFRSFNDEDVVISGCDLVTGWTHTGNDVWTTTANWNANNNRAANTLFVDGELNYEAHQGAENDWVNIDDWGQLRQGNVTTGATSFIADDLRGFGDDFWNGGKVTFHVVDWLLQTRTITDYDSSSGRITLNSPVVGTAQAKQDNGYYIYDTLNALDKPGEWFKEIGGDTLYYKTEAGGDPSGLEIEFKRRAFGFDVQSRDYIQIEGITFRGVSIKTNGNTDHNLYSGNTFYAYDKGGFGRFYISGDHNTFRDNEVTEIYRSALSIDGRRNDLINNYFHNIGFSATARVLVMSGSEHFVSHNTFRKIARSVLDGFPSISEFSYNLFEDLGRLSWDTAAFDSDGGDGNNSFSEFHHNVFRNTNARGIMQTFYGLNNNAVIHHNITYDWQTTSPRTTFQASGVDFRQVYHNTFISNVPPQGRDSANGGIDPDSVIQTRYNNNLQISLSSMELLGVDLRGNHNYSTSDFVDFNGKDFRLAAGSAAIDSGVVLPGVNDGFTGAAPDAGAIEFGEDMWAVGHDFSTPHTPTFNPIRPAGMNLFSNSQFNNGISDWTIVSGSPNSRDRNSWNLKQNSLTGFFRTQSVEFTPGEALSRVFTNLKPSTTYTVGAAARIIEQVTIGSEYDGSSGTVSTGSYRVETFVTGISGSEWVRYDNIDFGDSGQYDHIEVMYTRSALQNSIADAVIEMRLDSADGELIGTFDNLVDHPAQVWVNRRVPLTEISGTHSIYISVQGGNAANTAISSVRLLKKTPPESDLLTISAQSAGAATESINIGTADWQEGYDNFLFTTGPAATSATITFQNNGRINAYLDRLYLVEGATRSGDNIAFVFGDASQSSTASGMLASNATDENTSTFSETSSAGSDNWWQVQFPANLSFSEIELFNRNDLRYQELSNFTVSVWSENPASGGALLWEKSYFSSGSVSQGGSLKIPGGEISDDGTTRLGSAFGRVIRVQLNGKNNTGNGSLSLADLSVSTSNKVKPTANLALFGEATQSSNFRLFTDLAEDAINGVVDPIGDSTISGPDPQAWWQVGLQEPSSIGQIVVVNREGITAGDIATFRVSVWDGDPQSGGSELWGNNYSYSSFAPLTSTTSIGNGGALVVNGDIAPGGVRLDSVTNGLFVRVQKTGTGSLSLAEVQVWTKNTIVNPNTLLYTYDLGLSTNVFSGATAISSSVAGDISFTGEITATDRGASAGNEFDRDFIGGTAPAVFNHKIANGLYRVTLDMNDPNEPLDNMYVKAEGDFLASGIDGTTGTQTYEVTISDEELNLEFGDADATNPAWAVNRIVLKRLPAGQPAFTHSGGLVTTGTETTFLNPDTVGTIYYTTDGSDPRLANGSLNPDAIAAGGGTITTVIDLQDFDGVTAPAIPSGWSATTTNSSSTWTTSSGNSDGGVNGAFVNDFNSTSDVRLTSAPFSVEAGSKIIHFRNSYNTENIYDGGRLQISINGGSFVEFVGAGGSFLEGGYNSSVSGGTPAWSGNSGGFITTRVELPASAEGFDVQLQWRFTSDFSVGAVGWAIDTVQQISEITLPASLTIAQDQTLTVRTRIGDEWSEPAVYTFTLDNDSDGLPDTIEQSLYGDPMANTDGLADFDGDGQSDRDEWIAGTTIDDANSVFKVSSFQSNSSVDPTMDLNWTSVPGRIYTIWKSVTLKGDEWSVVEANIVATEDETSYIITSDKDYQFFRVSVIAP